MGLFDLFGGGTPADKAKKLKPKVTQKYGDAATRQKAIDELGRLKSPDAVPVLMQRFTFAVDPQTTDAEEKQAVFEFICALDEEAVPPVRDFLKSSDVASSWALKILEAILPPEQVIGIVTDELKRLGAEYTRDPEKKEVLLHFLEGKSDERIGPVALPFLHDMSDDVKLCALKTLASVKFEPAREELLNLLVNEETAKRVQTACVMALVDTGFPVQGFREKVEARLPEGTYVDKSGVVKKRGAS
ncbi:MAG: HEAT repeat domain-containing protein [Myxococcota bacterium]